MAIPIIMPKFGQMTEQSSIVEWRKREGDAVAKGDILFTVETDKSVMDVESFEEGTLLKIVVAPGMNVPVQSIVAFLGQPGEAIPEGMASAPAPAVPTAAPARESGGAGLQAAQLASALSGLASGGGFDVLGGLRGLAHLDRLALGSAATGGAVVAGKYLRNNVYLELGGGGHGGGSAQIEWRVRKRLSLVSRVGGQGDSGLSIRWRNDF